MNNIIQQIINSFNENELIFASKVYKEKLKDLVNEATYYKTLERMYKAKEINKLSKGIYYKPKITKYGLITPSDKDIISTFTNDKKGMIISYDMYNYYNLSTQISKNIILLSSNLDSDTKTIRNINIKKINLEFTDKVKQMISLLEVLENFNEIQDINYNYFISLASKIAKEYEESIFEKVNNELKYKKSTISFFHEILNFYNIENNLDKYLSILSKYKHLTMGEIYELTQEVGGF